MGIWMKHLSLQGFTAGSFVSMLFWNTVHPVWTCKHLKSSKHSESSGGCKTAAPFFYRSHCQYTRPWDFYNPNWYSLGNLHSGSLPWEDSFPHGHFSSPGRYRWLRVNA
jgi:hypothetical protein